MGWTRPPQGVIDRFQAALPKDPAAEPRRMFGCPCGFVRGNMFAGVFEDRIMVRLSEAERAEVVAQGGAPFRPRPGMVMKEYVELPRSVLDDAAALRGWVAKAFRYGQKLPAKAAKPGRPAKGQPRKRAARRR